MRTIIKRLWNFPRWAVFHMPWAMKITWHMNKSLKLSPLIWWEYWLWHRWINPKFWIVYNDTDNGLEEFGTVLPDQQNDKLKDIMERRGVNPDTEHDGVDVNKYINEDKES